MVPQNSAVPVRSEYSADAYLSERETQRGGEGNRAARIPKLVRTTQALKCHSHTEQHVLAYPFLWIGPLEIQAPSGYVLYRPVQRLPLRRSAYYSMASLLAIDGSGSK